MLKLPYEWKQVDLGRDNLTPEYLKMNPQHTVPTVKDGDLVITESRAAIPYLAGKAGGEAGEKLYPVNLKVRAMVDQRLLFDMGTFYKRFGETVVSGPLFTMGEERVVPVPMCASTRYFSPPKRLSSVDKHRSSSISLPYAVSGHIHWSHCRTGQDRRSQGGTRMGPGLCQVALLKKNYAEIWEITCHSYFRPSD